MLVIVTGVLTMAQLLSIATASNVSSRRTTIATILAEQKLEQLRALSWGFDPAGVPVSDSSADTTVEPESPIGGTGLQLSPATALQRNTPGFVDHLSASGRIVGRDGEPPGQAVYTRRWSIEPLSAGPDSAIILQVLVTGSRNRRNADQGNVGRLPGEARVVTVKARKSQ